MESMTLSGHLSNINKMPKQVNNRTVWCKKGKTSVLPGSSCATGKNDFPKVLQGSMLKMSQVSPQCTLTKYLFVCQILHLKIKDTSQKNQYSQQQPLCNAVQKLKVFAKVKNPHPLAIQEVGGHKNMSLGNQSSRPSQEKSYTGATSHNVLCVYLHSFVCVSQPLLGHNLGPLALSSQLPNTTNVHTVASGPKGLQVGIRIGFSLRTNKRQINHSRISSWQFSATCTIHRTLTKSGTEGCFFLNIENP